MGRVLQTINLTSDTLAILTPGVEIGQRAVPERAFRDLTRTVRLGSGFNSEPRGDLRGTLVHPGHGLADELHQGRTLRLGFSLPTPNYAEINLYTSPPQAIEYWRIERVQHPESGTRDFTFEARPLEEDLGDSLARYERGDGSVTPLVSIYELTIAQAIDFVLENCGVPGGRTSYLGGNLFVPGTVAAGLAGVRVSVAEEGASHLDLLLMIVQAATEQDEPARLRFRHAEGRIYVDVEEGPPLGTIGAPLTTIATRHCFDLVRSDDDGGRATALMPLGGPRGSAYTIGELTWRVQSYNSGANTVDVRTPVLAPGGEVGPVWASGALVGLYIGNAAGGYDQITSSTYPSTIGLSGSRPFVADEVVRLATDATGTEVTVLRLASLAATATANEEVRRYEDASPVPNLLEVNGVSATFENLSTWQDVQAVVIGTEVPVTTPSGHVEVGLTVSNVGDGIITPSIALDGDLGPYASAWVAGAPTTGEWLVEIIDGEGNVFPDPDAEERPTLSATDLDRAITLEGFQVEPDPTTGARSVWLKITAVALGAGGTANIVLEQATLTQSATHYEYRPGLGPHEVWSRAARELRRIGATPTSAWAGRVVDPEVLNGDLDVTVGATVTLDLNSGQTNVTVTRLSEEWSIGFPSSMKELAFGYPEADAAEALGDALGLTVRSGRARGKPVRTTKEGPQIVPRKRGYKVVTRADKKALKLAELGALAVLDEVDETKFTGKLPLTKVAGEGADADLAASLAVKLASADLNTFALSGNTISPGDVPTLAQSKIAGLTSDLNATFVDFTVVGDDVKFVRADATETTLTRIKGDDGTSVNIKGEVANHASLPASGNTPGDGWVTADTGHLWVWTDNGVDPPSWVDAGEIKGPPGPPGAKGDTGVSVSALSIAGDTLSATYDDASTSDTPITGTFTTGRIPTLPQSKITSLVADLSAKLETVTDGDITGKITLAKIDGEGVDADLSVSLAARLKGGDVNAFALSGNTIGAGDVPDLPATKITSGTLADTRIPTLAQSKVTNLATDLAAKANDADLAAHAKRALLAADVPVLDASKIATGTLTDARIPTLAQTKITSLVTDLSAKANDADLAAHAKRALIETDVPTLAQTKVTNLTTDLAAKYVKPGTGIPSGDIADGAVTNIKIATGIAQSKVTNLATDLAAKANDADLAAHAKRALLESDVPTLAQTKITDLATDLAAKANDADLAAHAKRALLETDVPALPASKITSGELTDARIPSLNASKITAGTLTDARIPTLAQTKITNLTTDLAAKYVKPGTGIPSADIADGAVTDAKVATGIAQTKVTNLTTDLAAKANDADLAAHAKRALLESDVPTLSQAKVTNLTTDLDARATVSEVRKATVLDFRRQGVLPAFASLVGPNVTVAFGDGGLGDGGSGLLISDTADSYNTGVRFDVPLKRSEGAFVEFEVTLLDATTPAPFVRDIAAFVDDANSSISYGSAPGGVFLYYSYVAIVENGIGSTYSLAPLDGDRWRVRMQLLPAGGQRVQMWQKKGTTAWAERFDYTGGTDTTEDVDFALGPYYSAPTVRYERIAFNTLLPADEQETIDVLAVKYEKPGTGIPTDDIEDGAITGVKIVNGSVDENKLADDSVGVSKIKSGAVTEGKLGGGAVTAGKLAAGAVTNVALGSDIDAAKITAGTLDTDRVPTLAQSKIADLTTDLAAKASKAYVQSRGGNLVTNGSGLLGDNTNFSGFTFDPATVFAGGGSFYDDVYQTTRGSDELISIDPTRDYRLSLWAKSNGSAAKYYFGVSPIDIDGLEVSPYHWLIVTGSTPTTLAQALNPGDTQIVLTDATGWYDGPTGHQRTIRFYGYTNAQGYTYPDYTYSRFYDDIAWNEGAITGNVITLPVPWAGPAYEAGRAVANGQSGGVYKYIAASNVLVPDTWTEYTGQIGGQGDSYTNDYRFPPGTAFVKLLFLLNRTVGGGTINIGPIEFAEIIPDGRIPTLAQSKITDLTDDLAEKYVKPGTGIPAADIADGAVTNVKLATGIDAAKLTTGTLPIARIAAGAVTNAKLASDIDAAKITAGTLATARVPNLDAGKITTGTFDNTRIGNDAIRTVHIKDGEVASAKLAGSVATDISNSIKVVGGVIDRSFSLGTEKVTGGDTSLDADGITIAIPNVGTAGGTDSRRILFESGLDSVSLEGVASYDIGGGVQAVTMRVTNDLQVLGQLNADDYVVVTPSVGDRAHLSLNGETLHHDTSDAEFKFSDRLRLIEKLTLDAPDGGGDTIVEFAVGKQVAWDVSQARFAVTDDLFVNGYIDNATYIQCGTEFRSSDGTAGHNGTHVIGIGDTITIKDGLITNYV